MDNDDLFNYLVATDQLDEFLGYDKSNENSSEEENDLIVSDEEENKED